MTVRLAVWDCDGTLVDSQAEICACMEAAFAESGRPPPSRERIRQVVGLSLLQAAERLDPQLSKAQREQLVAAYRAAFFARRTGGEQQESVFEGVPEAIAALTARGWLQGVATGKSERGLLHVLAAHDLADHFVTLQTADHHPSKPHPSMLLAAMAAAGAEHEDTVMIGDTTFDIEMACAIGVRAIGVAWGNHHPAELMEAGAEVVVQHPSDLVGLLGAAA